MKSHAEIFVRLSTTHLTTGETIVEEMSWDPSWNWFQLFDVAHMNADGTYPTFAQCLERVPDYTPASWSNEYAAMLWVNARALRQTEERLKERSTR